MNTPVNYQYTASFISRCENLRAIELSSRHIKKILKSSIAASDVKAIESYSRMLLLLTGVWAEARLSKLLEEWGAFTPTELGAYYSKNLSQFDRWKKIITDSFVKHYGVSASNLSAASIGTIEYDRFVNLLNILDTDLKPVIEVRNKLAHGQWVFAFNRSNTQVNQSVTDRISEENYLSLKFKEGMITSFSAIVHDLVISKPTFERDFSKNYKKIIDIKGRMIMHNCYNTFCTKLVTSYGKGKSKRAAS